MYPVMLNIDGRKCVIIGGGSVALRKAKKIRDCGGDAVVVSHDFMDGFESFHTIKKEYEPSDLSGAFLVTAATDNKELNRQIAADARKMGILSYAVDDAQSSDFILPASARAGDITVAASTSGKYPILAKRLRDEISKDIEFYNKILPILENARKKILMRGGGKEILKELVSDEMINTAREDIELFKRSVEDKCSSF